MKDIYATLSKAGFSNFEKMEDEKIRNYLLQKLEYAENCQKEYQIAADSMCFLLRLDVYSKCYVRLSQTKEVLELFDKVGKKQFLTCMHYDLSHTFRFHVLHEVIDFEVMNSL